jgi:hypothetical protein
MLLNTQRKVLFSFSLDTGKFSRSDKKDDKNKDKKEEYLIAKISDTGIDIKKKIFLLLLRVFNR